MVGSIRLDLEVLANKQTGFFRQPELEEALKARNVVVYSFSLPPFGLPTAAVEFIGGTTVMRIATVDLFPLVGQSVPIVVFAVDFVYGRSGSSALQATATARLQGSQ